MADAQGEVGYWAALAGELHAHRAGITVAVCGLLLVGLFRAIFRSREHHRLTAVCFALYIASIPLRAGLLAMNEPPVVGLAGKIVLSFGLIGASSAILFDGALRSFAKVRILRDVTSTVAALVAFFVILHGAGANIGSIVITSTVLTGVIGFALQQTLGDVIGGIALQLEQTMSIGDWITVGDVTGQVSEIRWRSTAIVTRNDDLVVIPNGQLAKTNIINLSRPVPWHRQWVLFDVHYRHPPNEVQRIVIEALRGVPSVKLEDPGPDCILYRMEQDHAVYAVRYRLLDLRADDGTDSEVKKRIWYALRRNGIEIPYPSRNIFVTELSQAREEASWQKEHARRLAALKKVAIFAPVDDAGLDHLAERCRVEVFGTGETILRQGAPGDSLYVIRRGGVEVRVAVDGIERPVATLAEGQLFGEMSLMTGEARRATVVAKGDAECYVIDRALFQEVLGPRRTLVHQISEILSRREVELMGELRVIGEEARSRAATPADLLDRIRAFFGLAGSSQGASGSPPGGG